MIINKLQKRTKYTLKATYDGQKRILSGHNLAEIKQEAAIRFEGLEADEVDISYMDKALKIEISDQKTFEHAISNQGIVDIIVDKKILAKNFLKKAAS